jgi:glycerol-3-phosphate dehydrogenase (NAD(P)+)
VIASQDAQVAAELQQVFTLPHFRSYTSNDPAGAELGGAVKNVYAIAAGMAHGLGLGDNAVAALVTRALAEMTRLGTALGGNPETFSGLSGVGDLIVTCFSEHSRNHRVGLALGKGQSLEHAVQSLGMVAEGVPNTLSIHDAARKAGVRTPILDAVYSVLYENKQAAAAMHELLNRDPRPETS